MVDHTDWSRWFAISSPHEYAVLVTFVELPKKEAKLRHFIIQSTGGDALMSMCRVLVCHRRSAIITEISEATFFSYKLCSFWTKICENFGEFIFLMLIRLIYLSTSGDALSKSLG